MNLNAAPSRIAVIGAGIAGAVCAHALSAAGHSVRVFDKSRGPGGRLATRRAEWLGPQGERRLSSFDHGAPGFVAHDAAFRALLGKAEKAGVLADWSPALAPGSRSLEGVGQRHLPVPDMPSLCRWLLVDASYRWSFAVRRLHRDALGWQLEPEGLPSEGPFDQVILAIPPAQAATLLAGLRPDWAQSAALAEMQPCWALMGVTDALPLALHWDVAQPQAGLLATVLRQDARPARDPTPGEAHWVLHAHAAWSQAHLESPADWVQAQMQEALREYLQACLHERFGEALPGAFHRASHTPIHWRCSVVHRWRYAQLPPSNTPPIAACWWDPAQRLGVCGDFLGGGAGGAGVEGAWHSAQALAECVKCGRGSAP